MPKGATFQQEPRVTAGGQLAVPEAGNPASGAGQPPQMATGTAGEEGGIETPKVGD
jgi:hypothetical protein